MAVCFFVNFFIVAPNFGDLMFGLFVPTIPGDSLGAAVGLVGAVIMPHNLYLHSALVLSRKIDVKNHKAVYESNFYNVVESGFSLFISFLISFAVIGTFASYAGVYNPEDITLQSAHIYLASSLGSSAKYVWGIGLLAAGQSSTMTGTYAG
jgi:natural resistance-associated macrophage protein